jgi:hypothetical protein
MGSMTFCHNIINQEDQQNVAKFGLSTKYNYQIVSHENPPFVPQFSVLKFTIQEQSSVSIFEAI